ncbi:MAG TPA: MFS transporter [Thermomicrobiales bacterium]
MRASRLPRLGRGFSALRHRNYRLFFSGQAFSVIGSWMQSTAQSWLVVSLTSSAFALGLVNVCQFAPVLILGLYAGVVADRVAKRTVLLTTQAVSALLAGTLAVLVATGRVQLWNVYALALGLGVVNSFDMPARQALVVELVGREDLPNAIALNSSLFNAGRLVGPAVAGALIASLGTAACFALNAVSFLPVIVGLVMMRVPQRPRRVHESRWAQLREGLAYVRNTPVVGLTVLLAGFVTTFGLNFGVWIPLLAKETYGVGAGQFGIFLSALGLGALIGALSLAFYSRGAQANAMVATAAILGVGEVCLGLLASVRGPIFLALLLLPILGFAMTSTMAMANTTIQTATPDALRGRVLSVYLTVFSGSVPIGALISGTTANILGTPASILIGGSVTALAAALIGTRTGALSMAMARVRRTSAQTPATHQPAAHPTSSGKD